MIIGKEFFFQKQRHDMYLFIDHTELYRHQLLMVWPIIKPNFTYYIRFI